MRKDIFSIPIFEKKIDLSKLEFCDEEYAPYWEAKVLTTYAGKISYSDNTVYYLESEIRQLLSTLDDPFDRLEIEMIWKNKYDDRSYQGYHIHPTCQWSFIIYENVQSKTCFLNPSMGLIQNQLTDTMRSFPIYYRPKLEPGNMILFPSFLGHQVEPGNVGTTISGNVMVEYHMPYSVS